MMPFMDFPVALRQTLMILLFCCMTFLVLPTVYFYRKKNPGYLLLSVCAAAVAYCCIQITADISRMKTMAVVYDGLRKKITELPGWVILAGVVTVFVLSVLSGVKMFRRDTTAPEPNRFGRLKVRIHDTFGMSLVGTKAYYDGQQIDRETVRLLFERCRDCFSDGQVFSCRTYDSIYQIGSLIGISLSVNGTLPEEETVRPFVCAALNECMLNTFRHAWGDSVTVDITDGDATGIVIRNNGKPPQGIIRERGGLKHLRGYAENLGITMTVGSKPEFSLMLSIPAEVRYGI